MNINNRGKITLGVVLLTLCPLYAHAEFLGHIDAVRWIEQNIDANAQQVCAAEITKFKNDERFFNASHFVLPSTREQALSGKIPAEYDPPRNEIHGVIAQLEEPKHRSSFNDAKLCIYKSYLSSKPTSNTASVRQEPANTKPSQTTSSQVSNASVRPDGKQIDSGQDQCLILNTSGLRDERDYQIINRCDYAVTVQACITDDGGANGPSKRDLHNTIQATRRPSPCPGNWIRTDIGANSTYEGRTFLPYENITDSRFACRKGYRIMSAGSPRKPITLLMQNGTAEYTCVKNN